MKTKAEIEEIFDWVNTNELLQNKAKIVNEIYQDGTALQKKAASVLLESFLFYSGFFTPLYYLGRNKLPNVAEVIKLIIRDECLDEKQELLTPTGWKLVKDITLADKVLQYNLDHTTNFTPVITKSAHYSPELHHFYNEQKHIDLVTSPNHRILTKSYDTGKPVVSPAKDYKKGPKHWYNAAPISQEGVSLTELERFLIALHANGSIPKEKNKDGKFKRTGEISGTIPLQFTFAKERKIERLKQLADKLHYEYSTSVDNRGRTLLRVYVDPEIIPTDRIKKLPKRPLSTVSIDWCKEYIDEIALWDGHIVKEDPSRITYSTTDKEAADYVQTIANLCGYRTAVSTQEDNCKESYKDCYKVHIAKQRDTVSGQAIKHELLPGGDVYGIEVKSGYLVTRRNNSITITGNSVHGTYIGYKFQLGYNELSKSEQSELKDWIYDLLYKLYENEEAYTRDLYDSIGWTEDVLTFIRYNANKALMNLGFEPLFSDTAEDVNPIIINGISTGTSNHDFFSQVGNGYLMGEVEAMSDEDYLIGL